MLGVFQLEAESPSTAPPTRGKVCSSLIPSHPRSLTREKTSGSFSQLWWQISNQSAMMSQHKYGLLILVSRKK